MCYYLLCVWLPLISCMSYGGWGQCLWSGSPVRWKGHWPTDEPQIQEEQWGLLGRSWEFANIVSYQYSFVDLVKAYDHVPQEVLWRYGVPGAVAISHIRSLFNQSESSVHILCTKSNTFSVGVGFRKGFHLSMILLWLFMTFMARISGLSWGEEIVGTSELHYYY